MGKYAVTSKVPVAQTRADIEKILTRYGARGFMFATDPEKGEAQVVFKMHERVLRFNLPLPADFNYPSEQKHAQALRSCWRCLLLIIKAKLEAVESEIVTFESEFLAQLVLPNRKTVAEEMIPQITAGYKTGTVPRLPWGGE